MITIPPFTPESYKSLVYIMSSFINHKSGLDDLIKLKIFINLHCRTDLRTVTENQ